MNFYSLIFFLWVNERARGGGGFPRRAQENRPGSSQLYAYTSRNMILKCINDKKLQYTLLSSKSSSIHLTSFHFPYKWFWGNGGIHTSKAWKASYPPLNRSPTTRLEFRIISERRVWYKWLCHNKLVGRIEFVGVKWFETLLHQSVFHCEWTLSGNGTLPIHHFAPTCHQALVPLLLQFRAPNHQNKSHSWVRRMLISIPYLNCVV